MIIWPLRYNFKVHMLLTVYFIPNNYWQLCSQENTDSKRVTVMIHKTVGTNASNNFLHWQFCSISLQHTWEPTWFGLRGRSLLRKLANVLYHSDSVECFDKEYVSASECSFEINNEFLHVFPCAANASFPG